MSFSDYGKPGLTTDMVLLRVHGSDSENSRKNEVKELQILLMKRLNEPQKDFWALPGGFVDIDEGVLNSGKRKLKEKTGIYGNFYIEQLYTWDDLDRDTRGRVVSVSYLCLCNSETYVEDEVQNETGWFNVYDVLNGSLGTLAFDHEKIIKYALDRLQNKIEYTNVAFNLLPSEFTISECLSVYELILQKQILNFRRKVSEYIKPLGVQRKIKGKQFRPSELYVVNKNKISKF